MGYKTRHKLLEEMEILMLIHAGQEVSTNNWFTHIDPSDDRFYNIKTIEYKPKSLEDIEREYNIKVVVE